MKNQMSFGGLAEGLNIMEEAIMKAKKIMEGYPETKFTSDEFMKFYDCVYELAIQGKREYTMQLYERFKRALEDSITSTVLPSLEHKQGVPLLMELVKMWSNYQAMSNWLMKFLMYIDRYFVPKERLLPLASVVVSCFHDLVFQEQLDCKFQIAAISLINQERNGLQIDKDLLKSVLDLFVDTKFYGKFEQALIADTASYYSQMISKWTVGDSFDDHIKVVNRCLSQENERLYHCLQYTNLAGFLEVLQRKLLEEIANKSLKKQQVEGHFPTANHQDETVSNLLANRQTKNYISISNHEALVVKFVRMCFEEGSSYE